jgi:hypothetical protein
MSSFMDAYRQRVSYLRLRVSTKTATDAERAEYKAMPVLLEGDSRCGVLVFPRVPDSIEEFISEARTHEQQQQSIVTPPAESPASIAPTCHTSVDPQSGDTITLAKPGNNEPKPSGRENLKAAHVRHFGRG